MSAILVLLPWMVTWVAVALTARSAGRCGRRGVAGRAIPAASAMGCRRTQSASVRSKFSRFMSGLLNRMAEALANFLNALSSRRAVAPSMIKGTSISGVDIIIDR